MIYLTEGNIPLNATYDDDIVQEDNSTYQLTFKFPTNDILWQRLREEKFLTADDLHGEQDFVIFEVEKKHGYIQVYANQVMTMLNHYVVNPMSLDRATGSTALSQFAGSITRENPFSFFSDIDERHTFNIDSKNAMEALTKDKHSIVGLWGGDLVRHGYQVRLLKNGGSENESLFMYKKNLSSYEHKTSTKSLRTRITFITTIRGEGENPVDKHYKVVVDSPLINKYSQIYEDVVEVNDQDVKDEASLREYGKQYFRTTLCDMLEDSIEIDVIGQSDVPVQMFDVVGVFHEYYDLDVRKKITKYNYSPMAKKLKSIGFGEFKSGLASAIGNAVSDAVKEETHAFETRLNKEIENADLTFDRKVKDIKDELIDGIELAKAKAEENKRALSDEINQRFQDFNPAGFEEVKATAEEALKKAGTSADLAFKAKMLGDQILGDMNTFKGDYQADLNGINLRITQTTANNVQMFSTFTEDINGRMAQMASKVDGKVNQADFQSVKETAQLYERILGGAENDVSNNVSRLVMSNQIFQTEVGKYVTDDNNLIVNSETMDKNVLVNERRTGVNVSVNNGIFTIKAQGLTSNNWSGFTLPIYVRKIYRGETYSLGFKYRIRGALDSDFNTIIKNHVINRAAFTATAGRPSSPVSDEWKEFQGTFYMSSDFEFGNHKHLPFYVYIVKNGWVEIKEIMLVRGSKTGPYKPSQFDDAYKMNEATRTQVTQLAGSYAIQNLNSAGDLINGINLAADGTTRFVSKLTHISGDTLIDNAVIKSAMIDKLKTANFEAGSVTTNILGAEAVTAEKVKFDTAFIQRLVSQQAFINELFAKQATITKIQNIDFTGNHIKGGRISSLNGKTEFDLQSGWIDMNTEAVGIRNRFPGKPLQFLIFGQGALNGVPGAYTQLMSNRDGVTGIEHTSAGIQIWNGRSGSNIQTAVTFYGKTMDFMPNSLGGGVSINTENRTFTGLDDIQIRGRSLAQLFNWIDKNFKGIEDHFKYNNLGAPGYYRTNM